MRVILLLPIFCLTVWSCKFTPEKKIEEVDNSKSARQVIGKKFFVYDAIDYYAINFDESENGNSYNNQYKSELDSFKMEIIFGDIPQNVTNLDFIRKLAKIGYKKHPIDKSNFGRIDSIFMEKTTKENLALACTNVYRDILIFKKDDKVVGTAKICFDCMANQIKGTTANTQNFGQEGDYGKLGDILRK